MQACTCATTASSTRRAHALPTCSTRAATSTHKVHWARVGLGSCTKRWRSTSGRWRANGALAAPVQPWPSAWRCGGLWAPPHKQGDLQSSASAAAATTAFGKSYKGTDHGVIEGFRLVCAPGFSARALRILLEISQP